MRRRRPGKVERGRQSADGGKHKARDYGLKHHALGAACDGDGTRHGGDIVIHNDHLSAFREAAVDVPPSWHADIGNSEHQGASFTPSPTIIVTVLPAPVAGPDCGYLILREQFGVNLGQCRLRWQ